MNIQRHSHLLVLVVLLIGIISCGFISSKTTLGYEVIFEDDFSDPNSGWNVFSESNGSGNYVNEAYEFKFYEARDSWTWQNKADLSVPNSHIKYNLRNPQQSPFFTFGISCKFYELESGGGEIRIAVRTNGYYQIFRRVGNEWNNLLETNENSDENGWPYSKDIEVGATEYRFGAVCSNEEISLYINDTLIAQTFDESSVQGHVKLIGGYFGHEEETELYIDNFIVGMKP